MSLLYKYVSCFMLQSVIKKKNSMLSNRWVFERHNLNIRGGSRIFGKGVHIYKSVRVSFAEFI